MSLVLAGNDGQFLTDEVEIDLFIEDLFMKILTVKVGLQRCLQGDIEITETTSYQGLHLVLEDFPELEITI